MCRPLGKLNKLFLELYRGTVKSKQYRKESRVPMTLLTRNTSKSTPVVDNSNFGIGFYPEDVRIIGGSALGPRFAIMIFHTPTCTSSGQRRPQPPGGRSRQVGRRAFARTDVFSSARRFGLKK